MFISADQITGTDQQFGAYSILYNRDISNRNICYFAGYSGFPEYPDYLFFYLNKIKDTGFDIIFTSSSEIGAISLDRLKTNCAAIIQKDNKGVDFGAWKVALELTAYGKNAETVLLANDSVLGPFFDLVPVVEKFATGKSDFFGLTRSMQRSEHIQSYFILIAKKVLTGSAWIEFWNNLLCYPKKDDIIDNYEIHFTRKLLGAGYQYDIWSDWQSLATHEFICQKIFKNANLFNYWSQALLALNEEFLRDINPCAFFWRELITRLNFPFLKRELLIYPRLNLEYDVLKNWKLPVDESGYDTNLISQVLSLGELKNTLAAMPLQHEKYTYHYYHCTDSPHFFNFNLIFEQKTFVSGRSGSHLTVQEKSSGKVMIFNFIYLSEQDIDKIITHPASFQDYAPKSDGNSFNLILPYSNEVIPFLSSLAQPQTSIFRNFEEYECAMFIFMQQIVPNPDHAYLPSMIRNAVDISDLKNIVGISAETQAHVPETEQSQKIPFFELLNKYHREYEDLPMWYKKIGQVFKILSGHKKVKIQYGKRSFRIMLQHKTTVNEIDKANYIRNWYYHEYDVLPEWYKRFGKRINKNNK